MRSSGQGEGHVGASSGTLQHTSGAATSLRLHANPVPFLGSKEGLTPFDDWPIMAGSLPHVLRMRGQLDQPGGKPAPICAGHPYMSTLDQRSMHLPPLNRRIVMPSTEK